MNHPPWSSSTMISCKTLLRGAANQDVRRQIPLEIRERFKHRKVSPTVGGGWRGAFVTPGRGYMGIWREMRWNEVCWFVAWFDRSCILYIFNIMKYLQYIYTYINNIYMMKAYVFLAYFLNYYVVLVCFGFLATLINVLGCGALLCWSNWTMRLHEISPEVPSSPRFDRLFSG